jgi:hypothetical protein
VVENDAGSSRRSAKGVTPGLNGETLCQFQIVAHEGWARDGSGVFPFSFLGVVHLQSIMFDML